MALYKYGDYLKHLDHKGFDETFNPGEEAMNAGIYRCTVCSDEIGIAKGHKLPPQNHHQHSANLGSIRWKLLVCAEQK
jgi:hypothetical protein